MIRFEQRAKIILDQLKPSDQKKIGRTLQALEVSPQAMENELDVRKLDTPDDIYLVAVGPSLRVLFQKTSDAVEVLDIVSQGRLNAFHRAVVATGE